MRGIYWIVVLLVAVAACAPVQPVPTLVPQPSLTPTEAFTPTPPPRPQTVPDRPGVPTQPAQVRFINATADNPSLTVFMDFMTVAAGLRVGQSTEPIPLDSGSYTLRLMPDGARPGDASLFETPVELASAQIITLVITNQGQSYQLLPITDVVPPLNAGESAFTLVNAIAGTASVGLTTTSGGNYSGVSFGSSQTFSPIPAGDTSFTLQVNAESGSTYDLALAERTHYTLVMGGSVEQPLVAAYELEAPPRASVTILNAASSLNAVDVYLNDEFIQQSVEYARPSSQREVVAGLRLLTIYEAGADRTAIEPLVSQEIQLPAGPITLAVIGNSGEYQAIAFPVDRNPTPDGQARLSFFNTLQDIPGVQVETSGGPLRGLNQVVFGNAPATTLVNAASLSLTLIGVSTSGQATTVEFPQNLQFEAGYNYLYLITGRQDTPLILSENVGVDSNLPTNQVAAVGTPQASLATFRFINAVANREPLDFWVADQRAATGIGFGQISEAISLNDLTTPVGASSTGAGGPLAQEFDTLQDGSSYTAIAYGINAAQMRLIIVADEPLAPTGSTANLRFINLSDSNDIRFSLGFSVPDPTPTGPTATPEAVVTEEVITSTRRSLPLGVTTLISPLGGLNASQEIRVPVGTYKLYIIDSVLNQEANTIPIVELAPGATVSVIAYQELSSERVIAFTVTVPGS